MEDFILFMLVYFGLINLISAMVCIYDKFAAIKGRRRISEKALFLLSTLGGSPFMFITMKLIRHKTKHKRFMLGLPLIMLLQTALLLWLLSGQNNLS